MVDRIDTETVDTAVEPKAQHIAHSLLNFRIAPVQIGLLFQIGVVVILSGIRIEGPGGSAELALSFIGLGAVRISIAPDIPIPLCVRSGSSAFEEPGVLVGSVIGNEIEDHLQAGGMGRRK